MSEVSKFKVGLINIICQLILHENHQWFWKTLYVVIFAVK